MSKINCFNAKSCQKPHSFNDILEIIIHAVLAAILIFAATAYSFSVSRAGQAKNEDPNAKIYYIDHELMTLVSMPAYCEGNNVQEIAASVLDKLREGQDFNRKIKRQIPDLKNGMSVTVTDSAACVNLSNEFVRLHPDGRICERLTVYQIVNSLTSVDGIDSVCFTINNEKVKCFKGFTDMRETFYYKKHVY